VTTTGTPAPAPPSRRTRVPAAARGPLATGAVVLAATAFVGLVDPNEPGHYPLCPTKYLTGVDCPGCGGLRATHDLVRGDVVGALDHNAAVVLLVLPGLVLLWAAWLVRSWRGEQAAPTALDRAAAWLTSRRVLLVLGILVLAFTVARNIGAVPMLAWLGSDAS
jgi:hypothetical protein